MSDETKQPSTCPDCDGNGYLAEYKYCSACYGTGRKDEPAPKDLRKAHSAWGARVARIAWKAVRS